MADCARQRVAVAGHGLLATAISESLGADPRVDSVRACDLADVSSAADLAGLLGTADRPGDGRVLVTASDGWDCRDYERIQALCAAGGTCWLPVRTELGAAVLGPWYVPREAGCVQCAELRRSLANEHYAARETVRRDHVEMMDQPSSWLTVLAARAVAAGAARRAGRSGR